MAHGGDVYQNNINLDFSVNINPCGIPDSVRTQIQESIKQISCYPNLHNDELKSSIVNRYQTESVILGNGASELIMAVFHEIQPKKVLIPAPAFSGYEYCAAACGTRVTLYPLKSDFEMDEGFIDLIEADELVILTNPNNPTGKIINFDLLLKILERCKACGAYLLVDECFIELSDHPEYSLMNRTGDYKRLMVLNAFTKSYGLCGIRTGFLAGNVHLLNSIQRHLPEWNVSVPAVYAMGAAVGEKQYLADSRNLIFRERLYLMEELNKLGCNVVSSQCNFVLFSCKEEKVRLYEYCLSRGILIRDCSDYHGLKSGYYRISVKLHAENERIIQVLKEYYGIN